MSLELEYYGGQPPETALTNLTSSFREVMKNLVIVRLQSAWQMDDILRRTEKVANEELYQIDPSHLESFKMFSIKMKMLVPTMFIEMKNELWDILILLQKYCLSFFEGEEDEYLETASSYKQQRKKFSQTIKDTIYRIEDVALQYTKGLITFKHLGMDAKELARKCYFFEAPILFIFADMCQNVREICATVMQWVQYDSEYPKFVLYDLKEVQKKRDEYFPKVRDIREKQHQLRHKIQKLHRDIKEITEQIEKLETKRQENKKLKSEPPKKILKSPKRKKETKTDKKEVVERSISFDSIAGSPRLMGIITDYPIRAFSTSSLSSQDESVPDEEEEEDLWLDEDDDDISVVDVNPNKAKLVTEKKNILQRKKSILVKFQKVARKQSAELRVIEYELERLERCYNQLRTIYTLRKSTSITKKLFNNVPMSAMKSAVSGNEQSSKPGKGSFIGEKAKVTSTSFPDEFKESNSMISRKDQRKIFAFTFAFIQCKLTLRAIT